MNPRSEDRQLNDRKFCFIVCTNRKDFLRECQLFISRLRVPDGYETDFISIEGADSMASGYNAAMRESDAKYKIYLHQDVFILNPDFLCDLLTLFRSDPRIGMVGMVGAPHLGSDGIMWAVPRTGRVASREDLRKLDLQRRNLRTGDWQKAEQQTGDLQKADLRNTDSCTGASFAMTGEPWEVEAADGLLLATQADVPWREDVFDGWDFYDCSQSMEMRRHGYKTVVPATETPWCLHDDGMILGLQRYNYYRRRFLQEYAQELHPGKRVQDHSGTSSEPSRGQCPEPTEEPSPEIGNYIRELEKTEKSVAENARRLDELKRFADRVLREDAKPADTSAREPAAGNSNLPGDQPECPGNGGGRAKRFLVTEEEMKKPVYRGLRTASAFYYRLLLILQIEREELRQGSGSLFTDSCEYAEQLMDRLQAVIFALRRIELLGGSAGEKAPAPSGGGTGQEPPDFQDGSAAKEAFSLLDEWHITPACCGRILRDRLMLFGDPAFVLQRIAEHELMVQNEERAMAFVQESVRKT